jgi:hypothetical protein
MKKIIFSLFLLSMVVLSGCSDISGFMTADVFEKDDFKGLANCQAKKIIEESNDKICQDCTLRTSGDYSLYCEDVSNYDDSDIPEETYICCVMGVAHIYESPVWKTTEYVAMDITTKERCNTAFDRQSYYDIKALQPLSVCDNQPQLKKVTTYDDGRQVTEVLRP